MSENIKWEIFHVKCWKRIRVDITLSRNVTNVNLLRLFHISVASSRQAPILWPHSARTNTSTNTWSRAKTNNMDQEEVNHNKWHRSLPHYCLVFLQLKKNAPTASLSAVFRSQKRTKLLRISGTCPGDGSHYYGCIRFLTCALLDYHIKLRDLQL